MFSIPFDVFFHGNKTDSDSTRYLQEAAGLVKIDSTKGRNRPWKFRVKVNEVVRGFEEGAMQISLGERARITIPVCTSLFLFLFSFFLIFVGSRNLRMDQLGFPDWFLPMQPLFSMPSLLEFIEPVLKIWKLKKKKS